MRLLLLRFVVISRRYMLCWLETLAWGSCVQNSCFLYLSREMSNNDAFPLLLTRFGGYFFACHLAAARCAVGVERGFGFKSTVGVFKSLPLLWGGGLRGFWWFYPQG